MQADVFGHGHTLGALQVCHLIDSRTQLDRFAPSPPVYLLLLCSLTDGLGLPNPWWQWPDHPMSIDGDCGAAEVPGLDMLAE